MKFTGSDKWNTYAVAAGKDITWNCYYRIVNHLTGSITGSDFISITDNVEEFSEARTKVEYQVGQFSADSIDILGIDIAYWKANVFDTTDNIEFKLTAQLNDSEVVIPFSGFADASTVDYEEQTDSVRFRVNTGELIAGSTQAYTLNTQYTNSDGNLILPKIPGVYIISASDATYPLKVGMHKIKYSYPSGSTVTYVSSSISSSVFMQYSGTASLSLDDGRTFSVRNDGDYDDIVLGNLAELDNIYHPQDTQLLTVRVINDEIIKYECDLVDTIIVTTQSNVIPQQPYNGLSLSELVTKTYNAMGVNTVNIPSFTLTTSDVQFSPIDSISEIARPTAMCKFNDDMLFAVGHKLYLRNHTTGAYTNVLTLTYGTEVVKRIIFNASNSAIGYDHVWIYYTSGTSQYVTIAQNNSGTWSLFGVGRTWTVGSAPDETSEDGIGVFSYIYTGTTLAYGLAYHYHNFTTQADSGIFLIVPASVDATKIVSEVVGTYSFLHTNYFLFTKDNDIVFLVDYPYLTEPGLRFMRVQMNSSGEFNSPIGQVDTRHNGYGKQVFDYWNNKVYYMASVDNVNTIMVSGWQDGYNFPNIVQALDNTYQIDAVYEYRHSTNARVFMSVSTPKEPNKSLLYELSGTGTISNRTVTPRLSGYCISSVGMQPYMYDYSGKFGTISTTVTPYIDYQFDYTELSLRELASKLLNSYNMVGIINSNKQANVYRRCDSAGNIINSGETLSLTMDEVTNININSKDYEGFEIVELKTKNNSTNYDGTTFDVGLFTDARKVSINSEIVPDALIYDVIKLFWEFFSVSRVMYTVECGCIPFFQYEPLDRCVLTLPTSKVGVSDAGIIYGATYMKDGTTKFDVLI